MGSFESLYLCKMFHFISREMNLNRRENSLAIYVKFTSSPRHSADQNNVYFDACCNGYSGECYEEIAVGGCYSIDCIENDA